MSAAKLRVGFPDIEDAIVEDYEKSAGLPPGTFNKLQGERWRMEDLQRRREVVARCDAEQLWGA